MTTEQIEAKIKECSKCKKVKPLDRFNKRKSTKDGLGSWCKECIKEYYLENSQHLKDYARKYRTENLQHIKEHIKKYNRTSAGKATVKKERLNFIGRYPEKAKCTALWVYFKTKNGVKVPSGYEFHHYSYKEEHHHDVIFLPKWLHKQIHRRIAYSQENKCYKSNNGVLLDTKEKHMFFIQKLIHAAKA